MHAYRELVIDGGILRANLSGVLAGYAICR